MGLRSGFVCILGRPNAGKSTLLNALVGEKVAIVTHKPQTTRNRILGIVNEPAKKGRPAGQIVFVDTPGIHKPDTSLNRKMMHEVRAALEGCDLLLLLVDATEKFGSGDQFALEMAKQTGVKIFLLLNKIDQIEKSKLLPIIASYSGLHDFGEIIPISALKKSGLDLLLQKVIHALPQGPHYFPKDQITDQPERFLVAELVREKILQLTGEEVPYAATVVIEQFEEKPRLTRIAATIFVEREGQKGIIIGKGGQMLKKIGSAARFEIEKRLGTKVFLELFVKVRPGWRDSREFVEGLDWRRQLEDLTTKEPER
ncbi:MAG TPA: GTPase Era [Terriglobales bacterium]|jgi:GTP-binding protein Era|nr:GTPase Era [Terriglobales bacterium]